MSHNSRLRLSVACATSLLGYACAAAHLDPNTKAVTFDAKEPTSAASSASSSPNAKAPSSATAKTTANAATASPVTEPQPRHRCSRLPDPTATVTDDWLRLGIRYEHGKLSLTSVTKEPSRKREPALRRLGRFSAELWIGCELLERVNFDFPLLGTEAIKPTPTDPRPPDFERNARFETTLRLPNSERATRLELYDRTRDEKDSLLLRLDFPLSLTSPPPP